MSSPLLRMPPELLQIIFDDASEYRFETLLCKALAPYILKTRLRLVVTMNFGELANFCAFGKKNRTRLAAVRDFLSFGAPEGFKQLRKGNSGARDAALRRVDVVPLALGMTGVESVSLNVPWPVAHALIEALRSPTVMPNLRSLSISVHTTSWSSRWRYPLDPRHWSFLARRPNLSKLNISISAMSSATVEAPDDLAPEHLPPLSALTHLDLHVGPHPPQLLSSFAALLPSLRHLDLRQGSSASSSSIKTFIEALPSPSLVTKLRLSSSSDLDLPPLLDLFPHVKDVGLGGSLDCTSPAFFSALSRLDQLEVLLITQNATVCVPSLARLLASPSPSPSTPPSPSASPSSPSRGPVLPHLRELTLDHLWASYGPRVEDWGPFWDADARRWTTHLYAWDLDSLPDGFDGAGWAELEAAVEARNAEGEGQISTEGEGFDAYAAWRAHEDDVQLVRERWSDAPPPFSKGELEYYTTRRPGGDDEDDWHFSDEEEDEENSEGEEEV
ncbi:hypothetical protein JCM8097_001037 [Rhodosporidiobolus ruineniae]